MFGITDLTAYVLTVLVLIALPGPNSMFCFGTALAHGFTKAKFAIMGTFLGNGTLIMASALGAGALLTRYPFLFGAIKMVGAAYLTYLGGRLLLNMTKLGKEDKPSPTKQVAMTPTGTKSMTQSSTLFKKSVINRTAQSQRLGVFPCGDDSVCGDRYGKSDDEPACAWADFPKL